MKKSLSTRLMYNFMTIIVIIVVGITAGISYLIADYFFKTKEHELADKGHEMAETIEYFIRMDDRDTLYRYIVAVDRLVGARIWLFDENYGLLAASYVNRRKSSSSDDSLSYFFDEGNTMTNLESEGMALLDKDVKRGNISDKIRLILKDIYAGKSVKSQIFHPYYKEQVILVGVPYIDPITKVRGAILMTEPLSGFDKFLRNIYIYTVILGLVALIFSLFIVKKFSKSIIKPLLTMKDSATAMASGDYSMRVEVKGEDEVAELGRALNSLGSDLNAYVNKMERTEKMRRDFVANVSHELRTPVTIIRGYNEAIYDGTVTDSEVVQRYRKLINEETIRLERMVRELLDISRLQASDEISQHNMDELPLAVIIHNVAEKLMIKSAEKHVKFSVNADDNIKILGNGDQMVQLILILSDNALKYSPENGIVSLGAKKLEDGSVLLTVKDEGPGIPPDDIPFIWERFYKVDKSHCRNVPGTGLGLAIAKEIIRMHGAQAVVKSECGEGATFEIKFPKDKVV
ncbi:MAG: HAMP domain-containing protein [Phascolarctobacterium sp.]|nr:HAMP domain-containing protein [Acidaminococcaceae bacterium]MBQ7884043.1 HAMP domain-containing protein [Phascolarctobacterium sp.]